MNERNIHIPTYVTGRFSEPLKQIFNIYNECFLPPQKITLNFSGCRFLSPAMIAAICALKYNLEKEEKEIGLVGMSSGIRSYLHTINFPNGIQLQHIDRFIGKTFVPLILLKTRRTEGYSNADVEKTVELTSNLIREQLNLSSGVFNAISYLISELADNIMEHSNAEYGFICGQYYRTKGYIDLVIGDVGQGIKMSYINNPNYPNELTDIQGIKLALEGRSTKNQAISRGFGISTSRELLVDGLAGYFFLWSGQAFAYESLQNKVTSNIESLADFKGCYYLLRIPRNAPEGFNFYHYIN